MDSLWSHRSLMHSTSPRRVLIRIPRCRLEMATLNMWILPSLLRLPCLGIPRPLLHHIPRPMRVTYAEPRLRVRKT